MKPLRRKIVYFVEAESLCGATVTLLDFLGFKDTVLDAHSREPTMCMIERQLKVCCTLRRSLFMRSLRLLPYSFEFPSQR